MAKFVDGFVTALGIDEPINLVFGDFGAVYGLTFAITHPNKVRKMAMAGSIGFTPDYQWHQTAKMWRTPHHRRTEHDDDERRHVQRRDEIGCAVADAGILA